MAEHTLYIDCDRAKSVMSASSSTDKVLPKFVQGDTIHFKLYLLQGFNRAAAYTPVPVLGLTIEMALGIRQGDESELYTAQYTWTASEDLADPYWEATLPMNTTEIDDLIDDAEFGLAFFEIKYFRDSLPTTVLSERVKIWAAVIKAGSVVPVATPTPLSAEVANATYLTRTVRGVIRLESEDGLKKADLYLANDGTFQVNPVV